MSTLKLIAPMHQFKHIQKWIKASNYGGADWSQYYVGPMQTRDSDCLTRSNFIAALEMLGGESEERGDGEYDVVVAHEGHWACGWLDQIRVHESAFDKLLMLDEIAEKLSDYPILDESAWSEMEHEELHETIDGHMGMFTNDLTKFLGLDDIDNLKIPVKHIEAFISEMVQADASYRGHEDAWFRPDAKNMVRFLTSYEGIDLSKTNKMAKYVLKFLQRNEAI